MYSYLVSDKISRVDETRFGSEKPLKRTVSEDVTALEINLYCAP